MVQTRGVSSRRRPVDRLRVIALSLPETSEQRTWGHPTFRVNQKMFAACSDDDGGRSTMSCKAAPGEQPALLARGEPFFMPSYVGSKGWIGIDLGWRDLDWDEVAELVTESYCLVAPKRLSKLVDRPVG